MSEFVECETKFNDQATLVEALMEMGWKREEIEVHEEATHLYGYQGDKRAQKANIILRKKFVGGSSNDIGFLKKADGTYEAIISEFDRGSGGLHAGHTRGYNDAWLGNLSAKFAERRVYRQAKKKGLQVKKAVKDGKVTLVLVKG